MSRGYEQRNKVRLMEAGLVEGRGTITARRYPITARANITAAFIHNRLEAAIRRNLEVLGYGE